MWARDSLPPAMIVFLVLDIIAVGLRIFVRTHMSKSFGYDDWAMSIALAGYIVLCALTFISLENGYGADTVEPGWDVQKGVKFFVASTLAYVIVVFIAKVSVALVLYRIAVTNKPIRALLIASIVILTLWTIVTTLIVAFQCTPLSVAWGEATGTCLPAYVLANTGYSISAMDIASSFLYAGLPILLLKGVQLSDRMKASVIIVLGLGIVSSIATVIRLKYLLDVGKLKSATGVEAANAYLTTFVYSVTELGLTLFTASLAALRPLLKYVPFGNDTTQGYSQSKKTKKSELRSNMGPAVKLDDLDTTPSQEHIIPQKGIQKETQYRVEYTNV
ncbi:uncharacterized protein GGS22DRAFT_194645 [Annulohypoxylon maeteangense]|uniref:uncharacterized protein n=1 Tax=Annulohypoxylon maeteangense TaxID=1927788 RepID=UPI00200794DA|nr:uncharacterized protein GGS22DRAFT_194645 [Annulohypoxylon maeteangense]KAI0890748.1 hypothetical protein GGS22DRAFT_194645 [Annulohypoxylon maeteangense]